MTDFTPGPWALDKFGFNPIKQTDSGQFTIAVCQPMDAMKANARLIAAAPELLEALEAMVAVHPCAFLLDLEAPLADDLLAQPRVMALLAASAAIAKAKGAGHD